MDLSLVKILPIVAEISVRIAKVSRDRVSSQ